MLFKLHTVNCYVLSLVFALMGSLQGMVFLNVSNRCPPLYLLSRMKVEETNPPLFAKKNTTGQGESAGQTWTAFFGSMGFCKRNLSGNGRRLSMENPVEQINNKANMDDFLKTVGKTSIP